ncbi:MAG TPA: aldo/keto reductase [Acetobacteraceae bacterium]|nr:aldo/keto reductase [Acetobacteraceae bacterium]
MRALDDLVRSGKIGYIGVSNFSGWHLMKALATSEKHDLPRYVAYQGYYSLIGRHYEWELMPLGLGQDVALMVWSPLGWGRLTGQIRRGKSAKIGRIATASGEGGPPVAEEHLFTVVDALEMIAKETGKSISQIALNWLLRRPTVANIVIGARNEEQLRQNLGAVGWSLAVGDRKPALSLRGTGFASIEVMPGLHTPRPRSIWPHAESGCPDSA